MPRCGCSNSQRSTQDRASGRKIAKATSDHAEHLRRKLAQQVLDRYRWSLGIHALITLQVVLQAQITVAAEHFPYLDGHTPGGAGSPASTMRRWFHVS